MYTMSMAEIESSNPFLFPVFFIGLWIFTLGVLSLISGWKQMEGRYRHPGGFQGDFLRFQSARMNLVNFRSVLNLGLNPEGLYMVPMVLFRPFHPPLLIPWEEIVAQPFKRTFYQGYQLQFRSAPGVRLDLYQGTFEKILSFLSAYPDRLQVEQGRPDL